MSPTPMLHHGDGAIKMLGHALRGCFGTALLVTGHKSFEHSEGFAHVIDTFSSLQLRVIHCKIDREPSPAMIDSAVSACAGDSPSVVVALGGGSVLDASKAIACMIPLGEPVKDFLEGVGTKTHPGTRLRLIALPTTSGTGSEATRNAVLSEIGPHGFKRSLRHVNFVPDVAILDPALSITCPPQVTAHSGMDAFTQLLESYVSTASIPITDALAWQGLKLVSQSLLDAYHDGSYLQARSDMALAAYLSGITLANAGLGVIHGLAGVIGGLKNIPHGIICSRLMAPGNAVTIRRLRKKNESGVALSKYANVGRLFSANANRTDEYYIDALLDVIHQWTNIMNIPGLHAYGVGDTDLREFARLSDNKNNPALLEEDERYEVLQLASR